MEKCFFKENFNWICEKILCCENTGTGCPEKCWLLLCWKYPSLGLPEPWITCVQQEVEPDALQRILTNWTFPSLSDPISKVSRFLSFNLEVRLSFRKKRKGRKNNEKKRSYHENEKERNGGKHGSKIKMHDSVTYCHHNMANIGLKLPYWSIHSLTDFNICSCRVFWLFLYHLFLQKR